MHRTVKSWKTAVLYLFILSCFFLSPVSSFSENRSAYSSYLAAIEKVKTGNFNEALPLIIEAAAKEPGNHEYIAYKGYILRNTGDLENALVCMKKAIELYPGTGWYYVEGVVSSYSLHDLVLAKEYSRKALSFGKDNLGASNYEYVKSMLENLRTHVYTLHFRFKPYDKRLIYEKDGTVGIPVPSGDLPYQKTEYGIKNAEIVRVQKVYDTELVYVRPTGKGEVTMECSVTKIPYSYSGEIKKHDAGDRIPAEVREYLKSYERLDLDSKILKSRVSFLKGSSDVETISNIIRWINSSKRKGKPPAWKTVDDIITGKDVECGTGSLLAVALARACGIPARQVWGPIDAGRSYSPENYLKGHAWFEFYLRGSGWIPVEQFDTSSIGLLPPSYIRMYTNTTDIFDSNPIRNIITIMHDDKWGDIVAFTKRVTGDD